MNNYYVEIIFPKDGNGKSKLVGLHESTGKSRPTPAYNGDVCMEVPEHTYNVLRQVDGDVAKLIAITNSISDWLEKK